MIVSLENVFKSFQVPGGAPLPVLDNFSCEIAEREFLCIVGPSGCGKSTLLTMLGGLEKPTGGVIRFSGERSSSGPLTTIVWQDYALIPWRSVIDNVSFGLEIMGVPKHQRKAEAMRHLKLMGIEGFDQHYPHQLSGGMRQRVGIARALTNNPEILLMDEPFGAVDAQTRMVLQDELTALWMRDRKTVLFITHSIEEALLLGDRVIVLSPRPARILEEITVPFPRPRSVDIERDPRFTELRLHIWDLLKGGVEKARIEPEATSAGTH
ncbi:MAG: ABC transporter ATP-binding protein [Rhizobiaceae bacterium]|nr:ABC transporter ATP-binding protein [Rhizobiaceae bacterium]